ncbi:Ltp family lipoprotein [Pedococcus bigeumensis]|uniref:DUF2510 domain-containing protein n=1 Tax=Pedococcus bigeumensis TaxID=433644 RepID=A0A502CMG9_9MICO|nr:Ltp family lipoprotein [Pedococcus bigeumensis]TPG12891.1 DUF2510 domain-containing protein [Pedococcus bigeumensis]
MSTPAGWYPQNDGQQRYWDGQQWTEHFAPGATEAALPMASAQKPARSWYVRKRVLIPAGIVALAIFATALGGGGDEPTQPVSASSPTTSAVKAAEPAAATVSPAPTTKAAAAVPKPAPKPAAPKAPTLTSGQRNAMRAAENYLELMGMSKAGLIRQLSSPAGDGYSKADATYAANHVKVDWNAEAVEAAKNYMEMMPMSRSGLIQQLSSSAGDQFTKAQATHAADAVL